MAGALLQATMLPCCWRGTDAWARGLLPSASAATVADAVAVDTSALDPKSHGVSLPDSCTVELLEKSGDADG